MPLAKLIKAAVTRWRIDWTSWHRWTAISLLVGAFLAVAAACQRAADSSAGILELIPVTVPELLRQLRSMSSPSPAATSSTVMPGRCGNAVTSTDAQQAHQRWHAYADEVPR